MQPTPWLDSPALHATDPAGLRRGVEPVAAACVSRRERRCPSTPTSTITGSRACACTFPSSRDRRCASSAAIRPCTWRRARRGCSTTGARIASRISTPDERIHLVADTSGSAEFWQLVAQRRQSPPAQACHGQLPYSPERRGDAADRDAAMLADRDDRRPRWSCCSIDLRSELVAQDESLATVGAPALAITVAEATVHATGGSCTRCMAIEPQASAGFRPLAESNMRNAVAPARRRSGDADEWCRRASGVGRPRAASDVVAARATDRAPAIGSTSHAPADAQIERPVFIVAAPRSRQHAAVRDIGGSSQRLATRSAAKRIGSWKASRPCVPAPRRSIPIGSQRDHATPQ